MSETPRADERAPSAEDDPPVARIAGQLEISEYALFELAWRNWHGETAPPSRLEAAYGAYLRSGTVPPWVRHFCRLVQDGATNPVPPNPGLSREDRDRARLTVFYLVLILGFLVVLLAKAQEIGAALDMARCITLPCR